MKRRYSTALLLALTVALNIAPVGAATLYGDLNSDGNLNSTDYALLNRHILGIMTTNNTSAADVNGDGLVNSTDYALYRRYLLGIIAAFPAQGSTAPTPTPTTSTNPEDAWELNKGTIQLGNSITYTGTGISVNGTTVNITAGGDHTVTGTLSNGMININTAEKVKLRLSGASITNSNGPAIYGQNADKLFITLDKDTTNTLADGRSYSDQNAKATIFCNDDLEIKGSGTLNITGNYKHAICSDDDINIENGIINVKSAVSDGIHANGSIDVTGGTLNITATKDCLQAETEELVIDDGILNLSAGSQGLASDVAVTVNGGTVNITKSSEGIESKIITINNGTVSIVSTDDGINATSGTGSMQDDGSEIIINGGTVYVSSSTGDSIDSNGTLIIAGGTTVAHGPQAAPEVGVDTNGTFTATGGTLLVTGPNPLMAQYPTGSSSQYSIAAMFTSAQPANSALCVKDSTGKALIISKPKRNYIYAVFSSPELKQGSTYSIYTGGNVSGGTEANGVITGGTYNGGTVMATITVTTSPTTASNWSSGMGGFPGGGGWGW